MRDTGKYVADETAKAISRFNTFSGSGSRAGQRTPWATAMLAKLRRAIGTRPGEQVDILELTADEEGDTRAEWALHIALTLFALHQQGSNESVYKKGVNFGTAVYRIIPAEKGKEKKGEKGVIRRFNAFATADGLDELAYHVRGLVQLMKQAQPRIELDYPKFARSLYFYQHEQHRNRVQMEWGRDFFINYRQEKNEVQ